MMIFRILFFCLFLIPFSKLSFAIEDKAAVCKVSFEAARESMLQDLEKLESFYTKYRWIETKIRLLTYENLWQSRVDAQDPLSKEMRAGGNHEEDRLMELLRELDKESKDASNAFWKGIDEIKRHEVPINACCPDKNYQDCSDKVFLPVFDKIKSGRPLFDHIFERERDYRKEVDLTVGSRKGLYPEDALEEKAKHGDYFKRYEMERRAQRFADDKDMIYFFEDLKKMLTDNFPGENCCQLCGKTSWEAKVDQMFGES